MNIYMIACLVLLLLAGCRDKTATEKGAVNRPQVRGVELAEVAATEVDEYYETSATVKARAETVVAARMMGMVMSLRVREGDRVEAGQLLLALDDRDVRQKIAAAEAAVAEAENGVAAAGKQKELTRITHDRFKNLFDGKALTGQELDEARTRMEVAGLEYDRCLETVKRGQAGLAEARVYQDFTRLTAPVAGLVTGKRIEAGGMAMPGAPLLTIEDNSSYRLDLAVNETLAGKLKVGLPVMVDIPAAAMSLAGTISDVVPAVDPATRSFLVKVALPGAGLQSGLHARVRIPVGIRSTVLLPRSVIVEKGQLTGVYVVGRENIITYRLVRLGKPHGENMEILSGLRAGEQVIVAGVERAVDGGLLQGEKGQ
ncbi:MAG: efflux RND transporter periplasmic adaptor subunit [Deltaproteobacteria bacterium]|nr:efflux RND transporter periplasmic adaptor subunit [Deltaproteobacteria bacterium]